LEESAEYRRFVERESDWLDPYSAFMAIRDIQGSAKEWQDWPRKYRTFNPDVVREDGKLLERARLWRQRQFVFQEKWMALRSYANERGVKIIGDMPIYVSSNSADVWSNQAVFQLGRDGRPEVVAGCPPDAFAVDGQIWGNPVYDWKTLEEDGFRWWRRRLQRAFELYDVVRLDHFIGFARYFSIPNGQKATAGVYRPGPGYRFFEDMKRELGPLPVIAEDLGLITPAVRALAAACGFPGMDIVQFVDGNDPLSWYQPRPEKIAYSGTHDNQTLKGYVAGRYRGADIAETTDILLRKVASCDAPVVVFALQDVIGLDDAARMNVPGTAEGNWAWQAKADEVASAFGRAKELVAFHVEHHGM
jgi:4-alpha-glucanotransferase